MGSDALFRMWFNLWSRTSPSVKRNKEVSNDNRWHGIYWTKMSFMMSAIHVTSTALARAPIY